MTNDRSKRRVEEESITHLPFPNMHFFIVAPNGTPVAELRIDRMEPGDTRMEMAALDVDRLTAAMEHMTSAQLAEMNNQLAGVQGRLREFMARPHPENGNGNGGHLAEKPSVPPEEPTPPAPPAPQPVVLPQAQPARPRRPRAPRRSAAERAAAAGSAATAEAVRRATETSATVSDAALRIFEEIQAGRVQEAESDLFAVPAQGAPAPLPTPPAGPATASAPAAAPPATAPAAVPPAPTILPAVALPSTAPSARTAPTAAIAPPPPASQRNAPTSPPAPARQPRPASQTPVATHATTTLAASVAAPSAPAPTPAPSSSPAPAAPTTIETKILAAVVSGPKTFGQLSMETGGTSREIFTVVKQLMDAGKLRKEGQAYRLP